MATLTHNEEADSVRLYRLARGDNFRKGPWSGATVQGIGCPEPLRPVLDALGTRSCPTWGCETYGQAKALPDGHRHGRAIVRYDYTTDDRRRYDDPNRLFAAPSVLALRTWFGRYSAAVSAERAGCVVYVLDAPVETTAVSPLLLQAAFNADEARIVSQERPIDVLVPAHHRAAVRAFLEEAGPLRPTRLSTIDELL